MTPDQIEKFCILTPEAETLIKKIFDQLQSFKWGVIEQDNITHIGKTEFSSNELIFESDINQLVAQIEPNFLLISSSLQYIEKPYEVLELLLQKKIPNVLLDRTMARTGYLDEVFIQNVPPEIYPASYPVWFLDANRIERLFEKMGYQLIECVDPFPGSSFGLGSHTWPYKSWFFELEK
jgi:putative methyltransferase (TIGR04325 family)